MSHRSVPPSASRPGALHAASLLSMIRPTTGTTSVTPETSLSRFTRQDGVYVGDASPGEVSLCVFLNGKRAIRLEIAEEFYSEKWFRLLETFVQRYGGQVLKLVD